MESTEINPYENQEPIIIPLEKSDTLQTMEFDGKKFCVAQNEDHFDYMAELVLVTTSNALKTEDEYQEKIRKSYQEKTAKLMTAKINANNIEISISFEEKAGSEEFYFSHSYSIPKKLFEAYVLVISNNIEARERFKKSTPTVSAKKYTVRSSKNV